ncbi:dynamin-like [Aphidius gifuensis]|uniref:dynamin-like n=1 Tax=Aphidius gifuensis TaxID=684658 RepID=UPI001CDB550E|nr:dynamin-like [Aphidius gifuensis]
MWPSHWGRRRKTVGNLERSMLLTSPETRNGAQKTKAHSTQSTQHRYPSTPPQFIWFQSSAVQHLNCSVYIDNKKKKRKTIMANNESMEKLIPFMNQIQDIFTKHAVSVKFDLPQIVVIGGQSAGKSSVLENFVGKDFLPRGNGIVTRRPLILQLITNKYSDEEYAEFEHTKTKKFRINEVCKEIENETDKSTVGDKGINPKPITLKIYSPTVLNLTLVDLPGLTKVPVHGQPADIAVQIRKMVFEYINKENALILAVTPANIDLATSDALELTKIVDPNGIRTIGVITKLDMMGEGTDARAVLENKLYPLSRGYVGVINRNQSDIDKKKSIADAIESEKKFFNTHPAYKFFSDRLGIHCLQRILNEQLTNHIRDTLPALRNELDAELSNIIKYLGENDYQLDDSASKIESLSGMHRVVLDLFNNEIGFYESDKVSNTPNGGSKINQLMHKFLPISIANATLADGDLRKEIMETIQNVRGARKGIFLPDKAFENVAKAQISKLKEPSIKCVSLVVKQLTNILLDCTKHMSAYPKLRAETENILISHLKDCEKKCKENLDTSIKIQLSYLNTENSDFVNFKKAEETVVNQNKPPLIQGVSRANGASPANNSPALMEIVPEMQEPEKFYIMIDSFLKPLTNKINDLVPKTIMYVIIENIKKFVKNDLLVKLLDSNDKSPLTELSKQEKDKRDGFLYMREALEEALVKIDSMSSMNLVE